MCKTEHSRGDLVSNVVLFAHLIQQEADLSLAHYMMQFFTFVPDPAGYITVLHKTDGSLTRCAWRNVPKELDAVLEREASKGVRHVTVGVNGSYVLILNSGVVRWGSGVPERLQQLLGDAERSARSVAVSIILFLLPNSLADLNCPKTVSLSLISPGWFFVEFADGTTEFSVSPAWHNSVNNFTTQAMRVRTPRMTTSYNVGAPSHSQGYQQHGQLGSVSPLDSYNGGISPGYTPFTPDPYLAPAFTGVPQQPVYNITNVYNNPLPQPQQQHETSALKKYNGTFTLLGGAIKLAGAVLAVHTGGAVGL